MRPRLTACCVALLATTAASAQLVQRVQTFDADPGWALAGTGVNGNDFGYRTTNHAGGAPGEAGGRFTRSANDRYYGDLALGGAIDLSLPFSASGQFVCTGYNQPDFGSGLVLGFFRPDGAGWMGLGFNSVGSGIQWDTSWYLGPAGGNSHGPPVSFGDGPVRPWTFDWDPSGGAIGQGRLTIDFDGTVQTLDMSTSERAVGLSVTGFGFFCLGHPTNTLLYADVFVDNVSYSVLGVPEPGALVLAGAAVAAGLLRRRRRPKSPAGRGPSAPEDAAPRRG